MSPEPHLTQSVRYAALGRRFHALRIDLFLCLGVFLIGGVVTGILLENSPVSRSAVF